MQSPHQPPKGCRSLLFHIIRTLLDKCDPRPPQRCKTTRPVITFMPGHIGVLAEYPAALKLDAQQIVNRIQLTFAQLPVREDVTWSAKRVTILAGRDRTLAIAFGDLPAARRDPVRLLRFINQVNKSLSSRKPAPDPQPTPNDPRQQSQPTGADTGASAGPALQSAAPTPTGFRLTVASPNWLSSGASQHGGTGGPGAWPIAATVAATNSDTQPWDFRIPAGLNAPPPETAPAVEVAILDTAPRLEDLQAAYTRLVAGQQPPHPLLAHLLDNAGSFDTGPNGRLHVLHADTNLLAQVDVDLEKHPYLMSDHGLFIAGIIGTLAPSAKLHLIEVLNPYGVGTLETIAQGFQKVLEIKGNLAAGTALVINCSLMLNIPRDESQLADQQALAADIDTLTPAEAQQMSIILENICALVSPPLDDPSAQPPAILIAAAGNDSSGSEIRHPARYPAAYANVTGVGALTRKDAPAVYSNIADDPDILGFAVFGGETAPASDPTAPLLTDPSGGMLGVFIGPLDGQAENPSGWARWAGTSFAAPIISGLVAKLLGGPGIATLQDADKALRDSNPLVNIGEVVHVEQG